MMSDTQLTRRLAAEHRLFSGHDFHPEGRGDQCVQGLNFETARQRREILEDFRRVLSQIYDPVAFCNRLIRLMSQLKWSDGLHRQDAADDFRRTHGIEIVQRIVTQNPEWKDLLWRTALRCYESNPAAVRQTIMVLALFLHLGAYARQAVGEIDKAIADIDSGQFTLPPILGDEQKQVSAG